MERYNGDDIYFDIGGINYEGRVVEGVSDNQVRVLLEDGRDMVISIDHIGGTSIADHPDLEAEVVLLGDEQKGERMFAGIIVDVFTDKVRKIEIYAIHFLDGEVRRLNTSPIRFVPKDAAFEDGGYLTHGEYIEWLNEQGWD